MKIKVGTLSPVKIKAIENTLVKYESLSKAEIVGIKAASKVSDQPLSLAETIRGAKNRAKNAFNDCDLSIGIESGLAKIPGTKTGHMNISVCAIYDGQEFHIGTASGFECPKEVTRLMLEEGLEMSHAFKKAGLTHKDKVGYEEGSIGLLTHGRVISIDYYQPAIINALIHLENKELYI